IQATVKQELREGTLRDVWVLPTCLDNLHEVLRQFWLYLSSGCRSGGGSLLRGSPRLCWCLSIRKVTVTTSCNRLPLSCLSSSTVPHFYNRLPGVLSHGFLPWCHEPCYRNGLSNRGHLSPHR